MRSKTVFVEVQVMQPHIIVAMHVMGLAGTLLDRVNALLPDALAST